MTSPFIDHFPLHMTIEAIVEQKKHFLQSTKMREIAMKKPNQRKRL
jgi:hypothetical protein